MTERKEKHKQKFKERGITLIALVITIIVLLILAGVALSALSGDSGILNNAESAKDKTNLANAKEQVALAIQGALTKGYAQGSGTITRDNLKNELDNIVGTINKDYTLSEGESPWTVTVGNYKVEISTKGDIQEPQKPRDIETLPSAEGTTPWLPEGFSQVSGTSLATGLTIANTPDGKPGTQNYVWIEVPRTISAEINGKIITLAEAKNDEEILEILAFYTSDYATGDGYDLWYDKDMNLYRGWDGKSEYVQLKCWSNEMLSMLRTYYGEKNIFYRHYSDQQGDYTQVDFESDSYSSDNYYFVKINDILKKQTNNFGQTYSQYQAVYSNMLSSIKKYGGFWLAQYEAGIAYEKEGEPATNRTSYSEITITKANYARDQYPYNFVSGIEAQKIANADSTRDYTSSLPYEIQWDLVCKFLEEKTELNYQDLEHYGVPSKWGNCPGVFWTSSTTSKYWRYSEDSKSGPFDKTQAYEEYLLTTGAIEKTTSWDGKEYITHPMNIYDFSGNVSEWTMQDNGCTARGGSYYDFEDWQYGAASRDSNYAGDAWTRF